MPAIGSRSSSSSAADAEATRISAAIDEELRQERIARTKRKARELKVILLGQAESGKSTLQKQFQLYYASHSLLSERPSWRPIVFFNIIKALRMILDQIDLAYPQAIIMALKSQQTASSSSSEGWAQTDTRNSNRNELSEHPIPQRAATANSTKGVFSFTSPSIPSSSTPIHQQFSSPFPPFSPSSPSKSPPSDDASSSSTSPSLPDPNWFPELSYLRSKLLPLVASEEALASELSGGISISGGKKGVYVRTGWQAVITNSTTGVKKTWPISDSIRIGGIGNGNGSGSERPSAVTNIVAKTLQATKDEVYGLWKHPGVMRLLKDGKLRLEESAAFFLDHIHRISEPDYLPVMDDILHVRLQTLGVTEHSFDITIGGSQLNWLMYDVGGARGQRHAWVPYFEDARAIIFLAPISAFDQYLEEDPKTNRIDDSLQLFTQIVSNKLLAKAALVLMLNKTDLLKEKLKAGIKVRKYISSYGDRPNNFEEVSEYFRAHFIQAHKRKDVARRQLYVHFTSMLDIKATQRIIVNVGESILKIHLADIGLA